mmetsp:Transcript_72657/g.224711  ORF Transcript_72657/g.224711 Transcript_72657/m.224711 type:complete len:207 (-) Transcript_72657:291-911(-)
MSRVLHPHDLDEPAAHIRDEHAVGQEHQTPGSACEVHHLGVAVGGHAQYQAVADEAVAEQPAPEHRQEGQGRANLHLPEPRRALDVQGESVGLGQQSDERCTLEEQDKLVVVAVVAVHDIHGDHHAQAHGMVDGQDREQWGRVLHLAGRAPEDELPHPLDHVLELPSGLAHGAVAGQRRDGGAREPEHGGEAEQATDSVLAEDRQE